MFSGSRIKSHMNKKPSTRRHYPAVDWVLCFIADSEAAEGRDMLQLIAEAVEGGATLI